MNKYELIQSMWTEVAHRRPKNVDCRLLWWKEDVYSCKGWGMRGWAGLCQSPKEFRKNLSTQYMSETLIRMSNAEYWMWLPTPDQTFVQKKIEYIKRFWTPVDVRLPLPQKKGAYIVWDSVYERMYWSPAFTILRVMSMRDSHYKKDKREYRATHWMPLVGPFDNTYRR